MDAKTQRANKEKVLRKLAKLLQPVGFVHTKPTFYTRINSQVVEFIHLHKFSFSAAFRVHIGLRAMNDPFEAIALNGPTSDDFRGTTSERGNRYDLHFEETEETLDRCASSAAQFVQEVGHPWLLTWRDPIALVSSPTSPLSEQARSALLQALSGSTDKECVQRTRKLLNMPY